VCVLLSDGAGGWQETQRFVSPDVETLLVSKKNVLVRNQQQMFLSGDRLTKVTDVTSTPTNKQWIFGGRWSATESAKERATYSLRCIHFSFTYSACITQNRVCPTPHGPMLMNAQNTSVHTVSSRRVTDSSHCHPPASISSRLVSTVRIHDKTR
jgi:hypothetical protein